MRLSRQGDVDNEQTKKLTLDNLRNNLPRVITILLYILINVGLIVYAIIYRAVVLKAHVLIVFARISAMLLNFNCSFVIVLMLKQTILVVRTTRLHRWLPIDDHIDFHKFVGRLIAALSIFHTIAHMSNFGRLKGE
jgi:predicted ferric reductase